MEEATEAIEQVMDAVLDTLSPSVADQLALLQKANPEAFDELRKQVVEGEVDGGIATHVVAGCCSGQCVPAGGGVGRFIGQGRQ